MLQSIGIDFICSPELSLGFITAAGRAHWKCERCFTHTEVKPTLTSTSHFPLFSLPPSALKRLPICPPTRFAATRCCSTTYHHHHLQSSSSITTTSTCICQTNDPPSSCSLDKYAPTLSLSLSLLIDLSVSTYRSVSTGCLQL